MAPPQWTGPSLRNRRFSVTLFTEEVELLLWIAFWRGEGGGESGDASTTALRAPVIGERLGDFGKDEEWTGARERKPVGLRMAWVLGAVNSAPDILVGCIRMVKGLVCLSVENCFGRLE